MVQFQEYSDVISAMLALEVHVILLILLQDRWDGGKGDSSQEKSKRSSEDPVNHLRKVRDKRNGRFKSSEKPKDDVRKVNEMLCNECTQSQEEYKRLKGVIEQLEREYDNSKEVDYFRRYGMLKGMIKRTILHLKLQKSDDQNQSTCGKTKEEIRKREEHMTGMNTEEVKQENEEIQEQIKEYKRKISMIRDLIEQMEHNYEGSKRYIVVQRYRLMKNIIKTVINNKWVRDS